MLKDVALSAPLREPSAHRGRLFAYLPLVVVPCLLLVMGVQLTGEFARMRTVRQELNEAYDTRSQIQAVFSTLQDAELGQRGFVITGNPSFLAPYDEAIGRIAPQMDALEQHFLDHPGHQASIDHLHRLIYAKLQNMDQSIQTRRVEGHAAAVAMVSVGEGKRIMDAVRVLVDEMEEEEARALQARVSSENAHDRRVTLLVQGLLLLVALTLGAAVLSVRRQNKVRTALLLDVRAQSERHRAVVDNAIDAIVTLNPSGSIEGINAAGQRMFGYESHELERRDFDLLVPSHDSDGTLFIERFQQSRLQGGVIQDLTARRKDGTEFTVEAAFGVMDLPTGLHVIAALRDTSERKRVERLKAEFVSTVSHELRTPLTSIAGSLGLITGGAAGVVPERALRLVSIAQSNCERLVRLINDILDVEKMESGSMALQMNSVDLQTLVEQSIEQNADFARQHGAEILFAPGAPALVRGDADRLAQVITNLLSNAIKFSADKGLVTVALEEASPGRVRLTVADNGGGIPEEFKTRIFSKFAQADGSDTRAKGGTGLGLAIVKQIVELHGGQLSFESQLRQGTSFHVDLPLNVRREIDTVQAPPRVLICDDDLLLAEELRDELQDEGFQVDIVTRIADARAALGAAADYAAMLLDLTLPDGDGLKFVEELQSEPVHRNLPIVVISGVAEKSRREMGPGAWQVIEWLEKPVEIQEVTRTLLQLVRDRSGLTADILYIDDDPDLLELVASAVRSSGQTRSARTLAEARRAVRERRPDLIILDIGLPDGSGLELLPELSDRSGAPIPVIVYSAQEVDQRVLPRLSAVHTKSKTSLSRLAKSVERVAREQAA